jgi:O-antigen/teichoic acid export membrane protein
MDRKGLIKAATAALTAQGITAAVSAITVFFLAGSLDAAGYGLWQLFTLAGTYSGLFHFGLCDGVYLRLGGLKYGELDLVQLGRQFRRMFICQGFPALLLSVFSLFFFGGNGRVTALCLALIYMPLFNATAYLGYVLQATGRTLEYSMSTVIDRIAFVVLASAAAFWCQSNYILYIAASIAAKIISLGYCIYKNRELVFSRN